MTVRLAREVERVARVLGIEVSEFLEALVVEFVDNTGLTPSPVAVAPPAVVPRRARVLDLEEFRGRRGRVGRAPLRQIAAEYRAAALRACERAARARAAAAQACARATAVRDATARLIGARKG